MIEYLHPTVSGAPFLRLRASARSMLRGWTVRVSRSSSSPERAALVSEGSAASACSSRASTGSESLCARFGPGRCGTRPGRPAYRKAAWAA